MSYWLKEMNVRIVQHNLRVVSQYYQRIRTSRLAAMIGLSTDDLEDNLSRMSEHSEEHSTERSASGTGSLGIGKFYVKIDRPAGVINFKCTREPDAVLSDWAADVGKMLSLMENTCHLISREIMVHKV